MVTFSGPPSSKIRNKPISAQLKAVLEQAAIAAGIDEIVITSGGQDPPGPGARRTGSTRHDHGRAADLQCRSGGQTLTFTNSSAPPKIIAFITAAAAGGATGIGAATDYMGNSTMHVGFGQTTTDFTKLTWGRAGRSANAPRWLRDAALAGWSNMGMMSAPSSSADISPVVVSAGLYVVNARSGLNLRGGPGTNFDIQRLLAYGTELTVLSNDPRDPSWVKVDLEGDGAFDGHVFAAYLTPSTSVEYSEEAPEPSAGDA